MWSLIPQKSPPLAGVRIEMPVCDDTCIGCRSPPLAGVRIEIDYRNPDMDQIMSPPLAGVRIEIVSASTAALAVAVTPPCGGEN